MPMVLVLEIDFNGEGNESKIDSKEMDALFIINIVYMLDVGHKQSK